MSKTRCWCFAALVAVASSGCGSSKGPAGVAAAEKAEQAVVDAQDSAPPGSLAKMQTTATIVKTYVNGKHVGGSVTWTCEGDTAVDTRSCQAGGKGDPDCKNTDKGRTCTWSY